MGKPKLGEEPQKPRIVVSFSILFKNKNVLDEFKKNCATIGEPFSQVIFKKMIEVNNFFAQKLLEEKITNLPEDESAHDGNLLQEEISSDTSNELEEEPIDESSEEEQEELSDNEVQGEIEEEKDVGD